MLLGFALGFTAKKALHIALVATGVLLVTLVALQSSGLITIHWHEIEAMYDRTFNPPGGFAAVLRGWVDALAAMIPGAAGFTLGFLWGLKKG